MRVPQPITSLSLVIPMYNEEEGLDMLFSSLEKFRLTLPQVRVNAIFVDDHSIDRTPEILRAACQKTSGFSFMRLSKRSGSHMAIMAGLSRCTSDCAVFIAADLQDPLDLIPQMIESCMSGNDIVWGVRNGQDEHGFVEALMSKLFYKLMKLCWDVGELPYQASFALLSRRAYKNLTQHIYSRVSLIVEIPRLGFSVANIPFRKAKRLHGQSKWTLRRKLILFFDSLISASYLPLRAMTYTGMVISCIGFLYAIFLIFWSFNGTPITGWTSLMLVVLILGGLQMLMLGIVGEYLWRTHENTRVWQPFIIEDSLYLEPKETA